MDPAQNITPSHALATVLYRGALAVALFVAAVAVVFFVIGVGDGSVSSFNLGLWAMLLGVCGATLWAGLVLRAKGKTVLAVVVLGITAGPGLVGALFLLLLIFSGARWN
ncbi:MAG: osmoprotectant transporter permease [Betaproteobacteria bacterium]|nr:osmoprotectant transporter permease [Betaproteobacteria bacterium]